MNSINFKLTSSSPIRIKFIINNVHAIQRFIENRSSITFLCITKKRFNPNKYLLPALFVSLVLPSFDLSIPPPNLSSASALPVP